MPTDIRTCQVLIMGDMVDTLQILGMASRATTSTMVVATTEAVTMLTIQVEINILMTHISQVATMTMVFSITGTSKSTTDRKLSMETLTM